MFRFCLFLSCLFLISGCSSREEVDSRLSKGCESGVRFLIKGSDRQISEVKKASFSRVTTDKDFRKVTLKTSVKYNDVDYYEDEIFTCTFMETYSVGYMAYSTELFQIQIEEKTYGKMEGGKLIGSLRDFMKLIDAVDNAMGQ